MCEAHAADEVCDSVRDIDIARDEHGAAAHMSFAGPGLGHNDHIAFNEPGTDFTVRTHPSS
jgi:6-phosphogluconolactonase/glucosamine-6-phosphate isomerase/deaminase